MDIRIVNCMRECRLDMPIDLEQVHKRLSDTKLYRGRPSMLVIPTSYGRNIQMFPSGVIQIMGHVTHRISLGMRDELLRHLRQLHPQLPTPPVTLRNLVVCAHVNKTVPLHLFTKSSSKTNYEPELFPAVLLRRFDPVHVALFHTGRCVITGLRSVDEGRDIVSRLSTYLDNIDDLYYTPVLT